MTQKNQIKTETNSFSLETKRFLFCILNETSKLKSLNII